MDLYHTFNRGVDKRNIFLDDRDCVRFIHDLYAFNDTKPAINPNYQKKVSKNESAGGRPSSEREMIVDIHGWCLMKNHYHLLLSERLEGGLTLFLRKLNVGYANYFNERYERKGTLFQGRTKRQLIERDAHFLYILHYIHLNPLDFQTDSRNWRSGKLQSATRALSFLEKYRWSSYLDYLGSKNFPSILTTSLFGDVFSNYKRSLREYLLDMEATTLKQYNMEY